MTTFDLSVPVRDDVLASRAAARRPIRGFGAPTTPLLPDAIRLQGGAPGPDVLPLEHIARAAREVTEDPASLVDLLQYSVGQGREPLRRWIAEHEGTDPDRVVVTNGALHGLALVSRALLDDGDTVLVDDPTYPLAFRTFADFDAEIETLPVGPDGGPDPEDLAARLEAGLRPRIYYTVPDFLNPLGTTVPAATRTRILELAERYGFTIVSDNPYAQLRYAGQHVPDYSLTSDRVVHVNTFSKTLGPGLRSGWVAGPPRIIEEIVQLRGSTDQHTSGLVQAVVTRVLETPGAFDETVRTARAAYARRAHLLVDRLEALVPGGVRPAALEGGIFVWLRLGDDRIDVSAARDLARSRYGTDFVPGRFFHRGRPEDDRSALRVGISHLADDELLAATDRLAGALTDPEART